jgi:hypothetical protein
MDDGGSQAMFGDFEEEEEGTRLAERVAFYPELREGERPRADTSLGNLQDLVVNNAFARRHDWHGSTPHPVSYFLNWNGPIHTRFFTVGPVPPGR